MLVFKIPWEKAKQNTERLQIVTIFSLYMTTLQQLFVVLGCKEALRKKEHFVKFNRMWYKAV